MPLLARPPLAPSVNRMVATSPTDEILLPSRVSLGRVRPASGRRSVGPPAGCISGTSSSCTAAPVSGSGRSTAIIWRWLPCQSSLKTPSLLLSVAGASIHLVRRNQAFLAGAWKMNPYAGSAPAPEAPTPGVELGGLGEGGRPRQLHAIPAGQALRTRPRETPSHPPPRLPVDSNNVQRT